tara:strand:+ start:258 stop:542 length:285 start_codon:yes stop_codon:yes gene_type:complete
MGYASAAQRKAVHANKADGGKGHPDNKKKGPGKKEDDIEIKKGNQGKFTAWAKKNMPGKDTCAAASAVMKNKKKYSSSVVKMANFAKNFGCAKK